MLGITPDQIAEELGKMVDIENKVICSWLKDLAEADRLTINTLFARLQNNAVLIGNLALIIRNMAVEAAEEITKAEELLRNEEGGENDE